MIGALSRRLRIRNDDTGKSTEKECTFNELETEDAIVLLGDPGMGKTTLFKEFAKENYQTVRQFLIDPQPSCGTLFLDALDEYKAIKNETDVISDVAHKLCLLKKPKFRLSCRAADWYGSLDKEALSVASASGSLVVLELLPLERDEILAIAQGMVPDPIAFIDEVESVGLGKLLGNPQTLILLGAVWGAEIRPRNKFDVYDLGVSELLKEINDKHVPRGVNSLDLKALRKAAGVASSVLLLSNSAGMVRIESADNTFVRFGDIPLTNISDLNSVLRRRLFISSEVDRFEPVHRTIAEFLAAEDLSHRVENGLPFERVMALMCGSDGKPVSSLRGLFAWLICRIGSRAEYYIDRDPYGVVTYGDASVLTPNAQCAVWKSLRLLSDPWFLNHEIDLRIFRNLANRSTADIIKEILECSSTSVHLKVAALEAVANSPETIGLEDVIRSIVLDKNNDSWLRITAVRAYTRSVGNNWALLNTLDRILEKSVDDFSAPEVRAELLRITSTLGNLALRLLSIIEQSTVGYVEKRIYGRFYSLINLPLDSDLDSILSGALRIFKHEDFDDHGNRLLFNRWLKRRLELNKVILPEQLSEWLRILRIGRDNHHEETLACLKSRFLEEPSLFHRVFNLLAEDIPNRNRSFWFFISIDIWEIIPEKTWPIPRCKLFLAKAQEEQDTERAADLFRMFRSCLPNEGVSVDLVSDGLDFINRRPDVENALGNWKSCEIEEWQKKKYEKHESLYNYRANNIEYCTLRQSSIRNGEEEQALAWAAKVFLGLVAETEDIHNPFERLVYLTNREIAESFMQGIPEYLAKTTLNKEAIIESHCTNSMPLTHQLLSLSIYMRCKKGMIIPEEAIPHCIASVVTAWPNADCVPDYNDIMIEWLVHQVNKNPIVALSTLKDIWIAEAKHGKGYLSRFEELSGNPSTQQYTVSLSAEVLKVGINENIISVRKLVSLLLIYDQRSVLEIGESGLARSEFSREVQAIWNTALFVIDPVKYSVQWKHMLSVSDAPIWQVIEFIRGDRLRPVHLTSTQRTEVVIFVGRRFPNVEHPSSAWSGDQNPWDASEFVVNQIKLIAADTSVNADIQLERLENDPGLESYRDSIRHNKAQHQKRRRDNLFSFASPQKVAEAILNHAPATPNDLLAYIIAHLDELSNELGHSQNDKYRAYWNEKGKTLLNPKHEETCTGILADDLQHRIKSHGLVIEVERHMEKDKECDIVVRQGIDQILPIEVKHHYHSALWNAWRTQLDTLYTRDAMANGLGIYLVLWSGEANKRKMPTLPNGLNRPQNAVELKNALESLIPERDKYRLRIVVIDITGS